MCVCVCVCVWCVFFCTSIFFCGGGGLAGGGGGGGGWIKSGRPIILCYMHTLHSGVTESLLDGGGGQTFVWGPTGRQQ